MLLKGNFVNFFDCNYLFSHYNESKHFLLLPGYPYSHKDLFWLWKWKYSKRVHSKLLNTYCWWHKVVTRYIVLDCTSILEGVTIWLNMYASLKLNRNVYNAMHTIYYMSCRVVWIKMFHQRKPYYSKPNLFFEFLPIFFHIHKKW